MPLPKNISDSPQMQRLLNAVQGHADERPAVEVLGVSDSGVTTDVTIKFRAGRHTPKVVVHVQSASQGGESYNPDTYISQTTFETQRNKQQSHTISRNDNEKYYVYLVPAVEIPPGCGTTTLFDGTDAEDLMTFADLGKRTVDADELEAGVIRGIVKEDIQESDFDDDGVVEGRCELTIIGPDTYDIQFETRQGRGTAWTTASNPTGLSNGATVSQDVDTVEGRLSFIAYEIYVASTSTLLGRSVVTFDPDEIANVNQPTLALDGGTLGAEVAGDADTATIYLTHTTDGTAPSDPTAANADQTINGRQGVATFGGTVPVGNVARVKARGENASGQLAPADTVKQARIERTSVGTEELEDDSVIASKLTESGREFVADVEFTRDDDDTVSWGGFTLTLSDGTTYNINAGTTGDMTTKTYLYFDPSVSAADLQQTTTLGDATGERRHLVAYAKPAGDANQEAFVVSATQIGVNEEQIGANSISANTIQASTITATEIAAGTITANEIEANTISASEIQAGTITATEMNVGQLSAIAADVGTLTAGTISNNAGTNVIDLSATGSSAFIATPNLVIEADGDAIFSGDLLAASGTFAGEVTGDLFSASLAKFAERILAGNAGNQQIIIEPGKNAGDSYITTSYGIAGNTVWEIMWDSSEDTSYLRYPFPFNGLHLDDGSTNTARVAGVVVSSSAPSGDYPEGTIWIQT